MPFVGGGKEISWDEYRAEQFGFLEEPHITVGRVGFAQFGVSVFFSFLGQDVKGEFSCLQRPRRKVAGKTK